MESLKKEVKEKEEKLEKLKDTREEEKVGREDTEERRQLLTTIAEKQNKLDEMRKELQKHAEFDPDLYDSLAESTKVAQNAVTRWTDNIFQLESWIRNKFNMERKDFYQRFQIPEDIDYLE